MKNFLSIFALCIGTLFDLSTFSADANDQPKRIVCSFSTLSFRDKHPYNYDIHDIPTELCTDLVYAFLTINSETWELEIPQNDILHLRQFTSLGSGISSAPNFILALGWEEHANRWSIMMADASKRSSFVTSVVRGLREFGFNGLQIYGMTPKTEERENYTNLIEDLVKAFKPYGYLLLGTVFLSEVVKKHDNNTVSGYDILRLSELLDWINVINHELRGPWNDFVDVSTPLYRRSFDKGKFKNLNVHDGMEIMVSLGAPRHKLIMGIPFFGRSYTLRSSSETFLTAPANKSLNGGVPGPISNARGYMYYYEICRKVASGKWTRRFDHIGKCPYAFHGDQWVGYEDEQSIRNKMDLIKNLGYGGAYIWSINMDDFNGFCGPKNILLNTIHRALIKRKEENVDSVEEMLRKRYQAMGIIPVSSPKTPRRFL